MANIKFTKQEKEQLITKIQHYFVRELDQELEQFDADFLLDFISQEMGSYFYNRGLYDAQNLIENKITDLSEAIYQLEQVIN